MKGVAGSRLLASVLKEHPLLEAPVQWLNKRESLNVGRILLAARADLVGRGRHLPWKQLYVYLRTVTLGEFLARWKRRFHGKSWQQVEKQVSAEDRRALEVGIIAAADARGFKRVLPRMIRTSAAAKWNLDSGGPEDFEGFVAERTIHLSKKFFENFDATRPKAEQKAARFLQVAATSLYLDKRTRPVRDGMVDAAKYLKQSKRLSVRAKLAIKLAYFPFLLNSNDASVLASQFHWPNAGSYRHPIKTIAERLGFRNPASLYRKLYRVRAWCNNRSARP